MLRAPVCVWSADMEEFSHLFEGVADPRRSNATLHDLDEMLMIGLLSSLCGGEGCTDMERFGRAKEKFLRSFMRLPHGIPSHDAFTNLFNALDPGGLQRAMLRLAEGWAAGLAERGGGHRRQDVAPVVRRRGLALPAAPGAGVRQRGASGAGTGAGGGQVERDYGRAGAVGDAGAEGADRDGGRDAHTAPRRRRRSPRRAATTCWR